MGFPHWTKWWPRRGDLKPTTSARARTHSACFPRPSKVWHRRSAIAWPHASPLRSAERHRFGGYTNNAVGVRMTGIGPACESLSDPKADIPILRLWAPTYLG